MDMFFTPQAWLIALGVFFLRVCDISLGAAREQNRQRGRKINAWLFGFVSSLLWIISASIVLSDLRNLLAVIAFACGSATGTVVSMNIDEWLAIGHTQFTIMSPALGAAVAERLRGEGFAITEIPARGKDGMVTVLQCAVLRRDADQIETIVLETDPSAFVTSVPVHPVRRGFWRRV